MSLGRDEDAVATYQRMLDTFPASTNSRYVESQIRKIVGAEHDYHRGTLERWAKALKEGCTDDMDVRVGSGNAQDRKVRHLGLAGLAAHAAELEKACKPTPRNRGAFASVYRDLAMEAARHEDCGAFRAFFTRYVEANGSISDMNAAQKHSASWCELGNVLAKVVWLSATLDGSWTLELDRNLVAVRYHDGRTLSLSASKEEGPGSFQLYLDATWPNTFKCREARWVSSNGERAEGTCEVALTRLAAQTGDFDEGTFRASLQSKEHPARKIEISDGTFRLRRQ